MHEGNLVICDQEQQYARNLLQMFARNRESGIQMYLFHTIEELEKFAGQKTVHTLLISREYPQRQREQIPAVERFVLVKSMQDSLAENEVGVYRYQSAKAIWSQLHNGSEPMQKENTYCPENPRTKGKQQLQEQPDPRERSRKTADPVIRERKRSENTEVRERRARSESPEARERRARSESPEVRERRTKSESPEVKGRRTESESLEVSERKQRIRKTKEEAKKQRMPASVQTQADGELIGIYSPVHRIGKTRFALDLGKELARKEPVLYLNLEEYSGGSYYFSDQTGQTLADLLYYSRQEKGNLGLRVSTMAGQDEELDYILPMPYVQDLQGVSGEEWLKLFEQILENCIYQKVILDLGDSVNGLFRILEACHTVYTPYIEDEAARAKLNQYAENLRKTGKESVLEKTIQKKLTKREG